jgi:hypothetical protein
MNPEVIGGSMKVKSQKSRMNNFSRYNLVTHLLPPDLSVIQTTHSGDGSQIPESESHNAIELHFRVYQNQAVIGWFILIPEGTKTSRLKTRYVCEPINWRLYHTIHSHIEKCAANTGFTRLIIHAAPSSKGFYRSLGYEPLNDIVTETGMMLHKMGKTINP